MTMSCRIKHSTFKYLYNLHNPDSGRDLRFSLLRVIYKTCCDSMTRECLAYSQKLFATKHTGLIHSCRDFAPE